MVVTVHYYGRSIGPVLPNSPHVTTFRGAKEMGFPRMLYMTGISCAGKTTLLNALRNRCGDDFTTYDFSDLLDEELDVGRDQWASLPESTFITAAMRATNKLSRDRPTVLTGHVFTVLRDRRVVVREAWDEILPCQGVVWLSVENSEVSQRRKQRGFPSLIAGIDADAAFGMDFVITACTMTHTPLFVLPNNNLDDLKRNVDIITSLGRQSGSGV
jgi:hypothetical protein